MTLYKKLLYILSSFLNWYFAAAFLDNCPFNTLEVPSWSFFFAHLLVISFTTGSFVVHEDIDR